MKYFTLVTLTLLAANARASSTPPTSNDSIGSQVGKVFDDIREYMEEMGHAVYNVFSPPKNLIKDYLKAPAALEPIVKADSCVAGGESDYWNALYREETPAGIERVVFCPEAVGYLKNLSAAKLAGRASGETLRNILVALKLRQLTLTGPYLDSFILKNFFECFKSLKGKLKSETDSWPCLNASNCDESVVKDNFAKFAKETESCQAVLKDQLEGYAGKVSEAFTTNKLKTAKALRNAILDNLYISAPLSLPFNLAYDGVAEWNKIATAEAIGRAVPEVCEILKRQAGEGNRVCSEAEEIFRNRLGKLNTGSSGSSASTSTGSSGSSASTGSTSAAGSTSESTKGTSSFPSTDSTSSTSKSANSTTGSTLNSNSTASAAESASSTSITVPTSTDKTPTATDKK